MRKPYGLLCLLLAPSLLNAAPSGPTLPPAIETTLNTEYPGWRLAPVTEDALKEFKATQAGHPPSVLPADFNNDGKRDYAVQIVLSKEGEDEQIVIIFLQRGESYEEVIVQSQGIDPKLYLLSEKKAVSEADADGTARLVQKTLLKVAGSEIGDTYYVYEKGEFHEFHPDGA